MSGSDPGHGPGLGLATLSSQLCSSSGEKEWTVPDCKPGGEKEAGGRSWRIWVLDPGKPSTLPLENFPPCFVHRLSAAWSVRAAVTQEEHLLDPTT